MASINVGRCAINDEKPKSCKEYPKIGDYMPEACTYHFVGGERRGECHPEVCQEDNCCAGLREGGEPSGVRSPLGEPCKHLLWQEQEDLEKTASEGTSSENIARDIFSAGKTALTGDAE